MSLWHPQLPIKLAEVRRPCKVTSYWILSVSGGKNLYFMKLLTATLKKWVSYWNRLWCQIHMGLFLQIVVPFKKQLKLSHPKSRDIIVRTQIQAAWSVLRQWCPPGWWLNRGWINRCKGYPGWRTTSKSRTAENLGKVGTCAFVLDALIHTSVRVMQPVLHYSM